MTFLEKYMKDRRWQSLSEAAMRRITASYCPSEFGYEPNSRGLCREADEADCKECWQREMPTRRKEGRHG